MSLRSRLFRPVATRQISNWGVEVARRCQIDVTSRLSDSILRMSLPEARGYIRARAALIIDAEMALLCGRTSCQPAIAAAIRERAIEETIRMSIGDLLRATRRAASIDSAAVQPSLPKAA